LTFYKKFDIIYIKNEGKSQRWYEDNPQPRFDYNNDPFAEDTCRYQQELIKKATSNLRNENELLGNEIGSCAKW